MTIEKALQAVQSLQGVRDEDMPEGVEGPVAVEDTRKAAIAAALSVAWDYSVYGRGGGCQSAWVIDQMVRCLLGDDEAYNQWVEEWNADDLEWDVGVAP